MNAFQATQADAFLRLGYPYVALTALWLYDYILSIPDAVEFIVESRWGLGMFFYLACSHLPFAFVSLNMLMVFQPDAPLPLCRSYGIANVYIGFLLMFFVESIFILRAYAVWERERWHAIFAIVNVIAYLVPTIICLWEFDSSVSGECWIPGIFGYLDMKTSSTVYALYCLLAVIELQILFLLYYRAIKSHGGREIDNRLMRGLMQHNLLYFGCSFAFTLSVVLTTIFTPFPFAHTVANYQVIVQAVLVTQMHRDFWRLNRASCGTYTDVSFTTWMAAVPDII
ncbi:uncharacterized protein BJ212DRAFT_986001 [Suillus subaureus]|uniref:DUF6533 domain-containing protein n=1 Tax=Suillus subaureus TaxID=48587 RepID=A0A9P7EHG7_9AGAM|nr:uncharacterized protein BJ212DRAFT_986001 [Suillus subaureus]KAG1821146.1 hypothetical protein BJ212DRAFT_986001 [Suillus subaureus]